MNQRRPTPAINRAVQMALMILVSSLLVLAFYLRQGGQVFSLNHLWFTVLVALGGGLFRYYTLSIGHEK